ncbi:MAG: DUF1461 domain-containing protein [Gammaproteobacteria bacterium]|nr:DUF1461 domain-containing protein [Gammaproteobacteria bacterium]
MTKTLQAYVLWVLYSFGSLLISFWLAWQLSAQVNFLYPLWYSALKIDQTIERTMPRHLYKQEFIATDVSEHHRLFAEIVTCIQNRGQGLEAIKFYSPSGKQLGQFLTQSEIIHLQDVAALLDILGWFCLATFILCLIVLAAIIIFRMGMPSSKRLLVSIISVLTSLVVLILVFGAKKFFYWLHTVVFPDNHQWFFYYEESLMSMLMKAPDLFAPISVQLLLLGIFIWLLHLMLVRKFGRFRMV